MGYLSSQEGKMNMEPENDGLEDDVPFEIVVIVKVPC